MKLDYKKEYKDLYLPKTAPMVIDVPKMTFIMVNGKGNPNDPDGEYQKAVELLYAITYTIKMSKMGNHVPDGYFEYVVPPLEGLWWMDEPSNFNFTEKDKYCWISMIRQPDFVTEEVFAWASREALNKKPHLQVDAARLEVYQEGLCVQCMHIGPYDDEVHTVEKIEAYIKEQGLENDMSEHRHHHEIYLSDPRKIDASKMKTVLRHPVKY